MTVRGVTTFGRTTCLVNEETCGLAPPPHEAEPDPLPPPRDLPRRLNKEQRQLLEYLLAENAVLRQQLGKKPASGSAALVHRTPMVPCPAS
jgi:hypothetical protein